MKIVLATKNKGKYFELKKLLEQHGYEAVPLEAFSGIEAIAEDGETFRENAVKKAAYVCEKTGMMTLADDSGLEVDFLNGAPGVLSSRFAGEDGNDEANNQKLLSLLEGVPPEQRTARFRCVVAIAVPEGWVYTAEGSCEGIILDKPRGSGGFGYDPLFFLPEYGKTFAELDLEIKNKISHRARAMEGALDILAELKKVEEREEEE